MADLASSDITVSITARGIGDMGRESLCTVTFGDGALTYPAAGIPMPAVTLFGMRTRILHVSIMGPSGDGKVYKWDNTNRKLRIWQSAALGAHTHNLSIIGGQAAAGTNTVTCPAATDLLGKQEAGDALVLGADVATKGGVVSGNAVAAAALAEFSGAVPATTLYLRVLGR